MKNKKFTVSLTDKQQEQISKYPREIQYAVHKGIFKNITDVKTRAFNSYMDFLKKNKEETGNYFGDTNE